MSRGNRAFVGANLFAKALCQTQKLLRLHRHFREQVRSHALRAEALYIFSGCTLSLWES
ncbi:hypothetical protein ALO45_200175 [Pseudomonas syringae pv. syringae]|nr:hypothetical protein ALO45_200175 [Pseudomonas syringae pv. syringae]